MTGRTSMFERERQPPRDRSGYTRHPDLPLLREIPDESSIEREIARAGYDARFRSLLDDRRASGVAALWWAGDDNVAAWTPAAPIGLAWRLVAVYACDSGPTALFIRPQLASPVALLRVWTRRLLRPGAFGRLVLRLVTWLKPRPKPVVRAGYWSS